MVGDGSRRHIIQLLQSRPQQIIRLLRSRAELEKVEPDWSRSIPFRFDRALHERYNQLNSWFASQVFEFHELGMPKKRPFEQLVAAVDCLLANFMDAKQISPKCFVAVSMAEASYKKTRYRDRGFNYTNFRRVIDYFRQSGFVQFKRGFHDRRRSDAKGMVSRIGPSDKFLELLTGYLALIDSYTAKDSFSEDALINESFAYAKRHPLPASPKIDLPVSTAYVACSDIIRLKDAEKRSVDYEDIELTVAMRDRLNQWNEFIAEHHHIDLLLPDDEIENLYERHDSDEDDIEPFFEDEGPARFVELSRVRLYRVFNNNTFGEGGRFYGGWWQQIPSEFRRYITINEQATKEYDYSNLHPAMLYAQADLTLKEDAYQIDGIEPTKANRKLIKQTFLKLINAYKDQRIAPPRYSALPAGWSWDQLQEAIIAKHQPIAQYFRSGIGLRLQRLDSDIAEAVMLRMMERDILVLPVHDSFITYHGGRAENLLQEEMHKAYSLRMKAAVGIEPDVSFIDEHLVYNGEEGLEPPSHWDVVDYFQTQPGYEGFGKRHQEFVNTRTAEWHRRFTF